MKPGIKTTEFWMTLLAVVGPVLAMVMDKIPQDNIWSIVLGSIGAVVAYITGRAVIKSKNETDAKS